MCRYNHVAQHGLVPIEKHQSPDGSSVANYRPGSTTPGYWLLAVADKIPYNHSEGHRREMASAGYTAG